jgi:hypothetical protein
MHYDSPIFISYIFLDVVALLSSACIIIYLCAGRLASGYITRLILYFHVTLILEDIAYVPLVYLHPSGLCTFVQFLGNYSSLSNAVASAFLAVAYRYTIVDDVYEITRFIAKYAFHFVFLFPLITVLPFIREGAYNGHPTGDFCFMNPEVQHDEVAFSWFIATFLFPANVFAFTMCFSVTRTLYNVYKAADVRLMQQFASTIGVYAFINVVCWGFRSTYRIAFVSNIRAGNHILYNTMPIPIGGILFALAFCREIKYVANFQQSLLFSGGVSWEDNQFKESRVTSGRMSSFSTMSRESQAGAPNLSNDNIEL